MQKPSENPQSWALAWRLARREMRGSLSKFRTFLAALTLGVAAIGAVGSVAESMRSGIASNARLLTGGDFELSSLHEPVAAALLAELSELGSRSDIVQMRAMLGNASGMRKLVDLKAVDAAWPLVGTAEIARTASGADKIPLPEALADFGVVAEPGLLATLGLKVGDTARLGGMQVRIGGMLLTEPDRVISFANFGPRLLVSEATLEATGLRQPGSFITYRTRFLVSDPLAADRVIRDLRERLADSRIRLRGTDRAAPGLDRFLDRAETFLVLVGLTALLIGGLGVGGAVRAWLTSRMPVIATLKCLGAPRQLIFRIYLLQVMAISAIGVAGGLLLASLAPMLAAKLLSGLVSVPLLVTLYPRPLLIAGAFGLLTGFVFALWPLLRAGQVRAAHLFRSLISTPSGPIPLAGWAGLIAGVAGLAVLSFLATGAWQLTGWFIGGTLAVLGVLWALGGGLLFVMRRLPASGSVPLRLALSAITRPGTPVQAIIIAFGLGLSVLVTIAATRDNLDRQIDRRVAEEAPAWFFIDIQPQQIDRFETLAAAVPGVTQVQKTPMLRGRVVAMKGVPAADLPRDHGSDWVLSRDRAFSWSPTPPDAAKIVRGSWWPQDYQGVPLVSVTEDVFNDFGLALGDQIRINVLGREITARIANTREVEWESFSINFVFVTSPNAFVGAPHSWIATTYTDNEAATAEVERRITDEFANISAISVREAVAQASRIIALLGGAVSLTALVTLVSGIAVLAGTVASTEAQRLADSVILKVLGATRRDIVLAWLIEYALFGLLTALVACVVGTLASWAVIAGFLDAPYIFNGQLIGVTALAGAVATSLLGLLAAARSLGQRPGPHLREIV